VTLDKLPVASAFLIGALLLIVGMRELARGVMSRSWAKTTGTVTSSTVKAVRSLSWRGGYFWEPRISFRYAVAGQQYTGSKYSASDQSVCYTEAGARRIAEKYFSGQVVDVYYQETQPDGAILQPGIRPAVSCIRFIILGLLACLAGWKMLAS
jgi:hypothetical protein